MLASSSRAVGRMIWETSGRARNALTVRAMTDSPARFSSSLLRWPPKRVEEPAAGMMAAKLGMTVSPLCLCFGLGALAALGWWGGCNAVSHSAEDHSARRRLQGAGYGEFDFFIHVRAALFNDDHGAVVEI